MGQLAFISGIEIIFILFIVIMVFGADKIPEIARGLGKTIKTVRNATDEIKHEITRSATDHGIDTDLGADVQKTIQGVKDEIEEFGGSIKRTRR